MEQPILKDRPIKEVVGVGGVVGDGWGYRKAFALH